MTPILRKWFTADIAAHFQAGLSIQELAERTGMPVLKVEEALRRWLRVHPLGKKL